MKVSALQKYILTRTVQYIATVFSGVTLTFLIMKAMPVNALESMLQNILRMGQVMDPDSLIILRKTFYEIFGIGESPIETYFKFLQRVFTFNFGPSIISYPTPAGDLVFMRLPWTIGLLSVSTLTSWTIGNISGALAGFFSNRRFSRVLESVAITLYPIPYYIMALILVTVFAYAIRLFPQGGGLSILSEQITLEVVINVIWHSILPALSLILPGALGWAFLSSRTLSLQTTVEDYVNFAELRGVPNKQILKKYVLRNIMPPQITNLALALGGIFGGALLTEIVFAYPGVGTIVYSAVFAGDINTLMAVVFLSILGVSTAVYLLDLLYPLLDPRIRHR